MSTSSTDIAIPERSLAAADTELVEAASWRRVADVLADAQALLRGGVDLKDQESIYAVAAMATTARDLAATAGMLLDNIEELHHFAETVRSVASGIRRGPVWTSWVGLATAARCDLMVARMCLVELHHRHIAVACGFHGGSELDPLQLQPGDEFCLAIDGGRLQRFLTATEP